MKDLPWFDAIHDVMKDRAVTNPPHVIDSSNTQLVDVSRQDSEEDELLTSVPHENPSIEETIGGDGSEEELIQTSSVEGRQIPSSIQPNSCVQMPTTEQRERFELLERERIKQEEEKARRESLKDDQFMALFTQFVANISQNPGPSTLLQRHLRPVASSRTMGLRIALTQKLRSLSQINYMTFSCASSSNLC